MKECVLEMSEQPNIRLTKQHFKTGIYKAYFEYIARNYPNVDLSMICARAGLSYEYMQDTSKWVSVEFDTRFTHLCIEATGDSHLCYEVGRTSLSPSVVGKVMFNLLKFGSSMPAFFAVIPKIMNMYAKAVKIEILSTKKGFLKVTVSPNYDILSAEEVKILLQNFDNISFNQIGYWTAAPLIKKLEPAKINRTEEVDSRGNPKYIVEIKYPIERMASVFYMALFSVVASITTFSILTTLDYLEILGRFQFSTSVGIAFFATLLTNAFETAKKGINRAFVALHEKDRQYMELYEANRTTERLKGAYQKLFAEEFLTLLGIQDVTQLKIGDSVNCFVTILFLDVRGYTSLSERTRLEDPIKMMNFLLNHVTPICKKYGGFIDKYPGDGLIAIFKTDPVDALNAANEIAQVVPFLDFSSLSGEIKNIEIGIGVNCGNTVVGTLGSQERMDVTVVGDSVNSASRLENLNKRFGSTILASAACFQESNRPNEISAITKRSLGTPAIRGKEKLVEVYELLGHLKFDAQQLMASYVADFKEAVIYFEHKEYENAITRLEQILEINPQDTVARKLLRDSEAAIQADLSHVA